MTTEQKPALEVVAYSVDWPARVEVIAPDRFYGADDTHRMNCHLSYVQGVGPVPDPLVRLADHEAACEALRKDAARYKWIRDRKGDIVAEQYRDGWATCLPGKALDAAIDAALVAAKGDS